jgi:hypothetical protein
MRDFWFSVADVAIGDSHAKALSSYSALPV